MLASGCTENQYSKGKEKVVSNVHFINANLRAVGDNTYAYFASGNRCVGHISLPIWLFIPGFVVALVSGGL